MMSIEELMQQLQHGHDLRQKHHFEEALAIVKACLRDYPNHPEVFCLLAVLQLDQKQYNEAEKSINSAIALKPNKPDYYYFLGQILKSQGRLAEAENALKTCLKQNPQHAHAYLNLGNVYDLQNKMPEALEAYQRAIALKPNLSSALYGLAVIYHKQEKLTEAIEAYEKALEKDPENVEILNNYGAALTKSGQYVKAVSEYQKALKINPQYASALTNLGGTYIELEQYDEAQKVLRQSLEMDPTLAANWRNLTSSIQYSSLNNPDVRQIQELLKNPKLPEEDKIHLYFALGKIYHDSKYYDVAFEYYQKANDLQSKKIKFNPARFKSHISHIIKTFDEDLMGRFHLEKEDHPQPLFIIGTSRSGKSLLEKIMKQIPSICAGGEIGIINHVSKLQNLSKGSYPFWMSSLTIDEAKAIKKSYLKRLLRDAKKDDRYVMDTLSGNFLYLGLLAILFPGAKYIFCNRDPMDTCLRMYFKYYVQGHAYSYTQEDLGSYYQQFQRLMAHWKKLMPGLIYNLDYEALVQSPIESMELITRYLGMKKGHFDFTWLSRAEIGGWHHYEKYLSPLIQALEAEVPLEEENLPSSEWHDLIESAYEHYHNADFEGAKRLCEEAMALKPQEFATHYLMGMIDYHEGKYEDALKTFEVASKIAPSHIQLHVDMANVYKALNKQAEADEELKIVEKILAERKKEKVIVLSKEQREALLLPFSLTPHVIDEYEKRLLLMGKLPENVKPEPYRSQSEDRYFTDLSVGGFRNIEVDNKQRWRMRTWHFLFKNISLVDHLLSLPQSQIRILDIGCASGHLLRFLEGNIDEHLNKEILYWGVDIRQDELEIAVKGTDDLESGAIGNQVPSLFLLHDVTHGLPFRDNFFDVIVNFEMINYLPIQQGKNLLREIYRVIDPSGMLYLSASYSSRMPGYMQSVPFEQFEMLLQEIGFQNIQKRGSSAKFNTLSSHISENHAPLVKDLLKIYPAEMVAAMITPLYPICASQITFECKPRG